LNVKYGDGNCMPKNIKNMKKKEIITTKKIDSWINKNFKKIPGDRLTFTAETIFMSSKSEGFLCKAEVKDILSDGDLKTIAGIRLLLKCMSENRTFHTSTFPELDSKDNLYKFDVYEFGDIDEKFYDVLAIDGMSYLITGYLEGLYSVKVDFEELIKFASKDI